MSALTRFGPKVAKSALFHHSRHHMASSSAATDPIQRLFADKIREFRDSKKGLDEAHKKLQAEEMARLARVYRIEDESKLTHLDHKFPSEIDVSLRDLDESKALRQKIASGQYQAELSVETAKQSPLIASIAPQVTQDLHLPPSNKPDTVLLLDSLGKPTPTTMGEIRPDFEHTGEKMTPAKLEEDLLVKFGPNMPTIDDDKSPERDAVNFPRVNISDYAPATRHHFIPESWFQFFYPKTGVSGPYVFTGSVLTFLLSKEWLVWEHELLTGVTTSLIFTYAVIKFGPKISTWFRGEIKADHDAWEHWRTGNISLLSQIEDHYSKQVGKSGVMKDLFDVRQQDVEIQLEAEYRNRLKTIYEDTKRRLNYLVAKADSDRQIQHKNLVNWVINEAVQAFGQKQENDVLDGCIFELKNLAAKNANAI